MIHLIGVSQLRLFQEVEGCKDVRLVRDFLKRSKGYAYVDFDSPEHVAEAVQKFSGHPVNNRPMPHGFSSTCSRDSGGSRRPCPPSSSTKRRCFS